MWRWLQNNNKSYFKILFKKIFVVSLLMHLVLLIVFLFILRDKTLNLDIFLNKDLITNPPVPVIFLPFAKNVPGSIEQLKKLSKRARAKKTKQISAKKAIAIKAKNKVAKKAIIIQKQTKNKKVTKKAKLPEVVKEEIKKPEPVKVEPPIEPEKIEEKVPEVINEVLPEETKLLDEPLAIYLGTQDMQGYQLVVSIQQEILKYWKPPLGLPKNVECKVNIKVDKDGKVENFKIEKSSNILAYDISLRNAILKTTMPTEVKGREFILTLNC
ncbi:MAG: TonB C-terminal domain-containing protein [Candidatus Babeliales bacterium]|nr:TonB C-terminal domain-containing protein [Candidatus Babeliales bacterium]